MAFMTLSWISSLFLLLPGMQFNDVTGTFQQQDVELDKLFIDVACYNNRVMSGAHMG